MTDAQLQMEYRLLEMRNAIADKEQCIANANMETQHKDGWSCDWNEGIWNAEQRIQAIKNAIDSDAAVDASEDAWHRWGE